MKKHDKYTGHLLVAGVAALVASSIVALGSLSRAEVTQTQIDDCKARCEADTDPSMPNPKDCALWCQDGDYKSAPPPNGDAAQSTVSSCDWSQWNDPGCARAVCNVDTKQISCVERYPTSGGSSGGSGGQGQGCPVPSSYDPSQCVSYCTTTMGQSQELCQGACTDGCPCGPADSCPRGLSQGGQQTSPPTQQSPYDSCRSHGYSIEYVASENEQQTCRDESTRRGQGDSFCICIDGNPDGVGPRQSGQPQGEVPGNSQQSPGGMCGERQDRLPGYGYHWACRNGAWVREADGQGGEQQGGDVSNGAPPMSPPEGPVQWPEEGIDVCGAVQANGGHPVCFKGTAWNGNVRVCAKMGLPMVGQQECIGPVYQIDRPDHSGGASQYHSGPSGPSIGGGVMGGPGGGEELEMIVAKITRSPIAIKMFTKKVMSAIKRDRYRGEEELTAWQAMLEAVQDNVETVIEKFAETKPNVAKKYRKLIPAIENTLSTLEQELETVDDRGSDKAGL